MTSRLLVVGGGIAGFGMVLLRDVPCTLVERLGAPSGGHGAESARERQALAASASPTRSPGAACPSGGGNTGTRPDGCCSLDEAAFWGAVGPSVCLRRGDLLDILRAATAEVTPRWNTPVDHRRAGDDGVRVQLGAGPATETYDFVVGADGVHSSVRRAVLPASNPRLSLMTEASWRFIAPNPGVDCWTVWSGAQGTFGLILVDREQVYGFAQATRGGAAGDDPRWLETTFADFPWARRHHGGGAASGPGPAVPRAGGGGPLRALEPRPAGPDRRRRPCHRAGVGPGGGAGPGGRDRPGRPAGRTQ